MDASVQVAPAATTTGGTLRPRFFGILRGELFKVSRQWSVWVMGVLLAGVVLLPYLILLTLKNLPAQLAVQPLTTLYRMMGISLFLLRVFVGPLLIVVTARLIGMEYSGGTIRVLLGRGVGRLQLLSAKLLAAAIVALIALVGALVLNVVLTVALLSLVVGNLDAFKALNSGFWQDTGLFLVTVLISMGVTILMAAAVTVIGRSLTFGLSAALAFFPADNIGTIFFFLGFALTKSTFWTLATGDLLGPNLNVMARELLPDRADAAKLGGGGLAPPLVPVTGGHTLLVTAIWAAAFLVVAVVLTWRRDVKE